MIDLWLVEQEKQQKYSRMRVATAVIGGTALLGAGSSIMSGNSQAKAATNAMNQANATLDKNYQQTREDLAPYRTAGTNALNTIGTDISTGTGFAKPFDLNSFYSDPGYQFQLNQGNQAIQRSAAANGGLLSGAAAKAIAQYTTGLANTTYGDAYNRYLQNRQQQSGELFNLAGLGANANNTLASVGMNTAGQESQNTVAGITGAANAKAAGYMGATNALSAGAGGIANYQLGTQALNKIGNVGAYGANPYQTGAAISNISGYLPGYMPGMGVMG